MSEVSIKIENLSKQYRLGVIGTGTLSHDLNRWWARMRGKEDPALKIGSSNVLSEAGGEYVWALRDINLEFRKGDIVGIIGKNGAGKSTLLKILSRVTTPTKGYAGMNGRVASLLEVGTGFHPELTGKENIFLNGAILGMTKKEIRLKYDEIVDFSGVEKYIDTPVKRYSSGMYVRLAFAVAAHLDPEILIVDEVLAVGDADFQKKAIGKMKEVGAGSGRTVLFVSHNMQAVKSLCKSGIVLENGTLAHTGTAESGIAYYLGGGKNHPNYKKVKPGDSLVKLEHIEIKEIGIRGQGKDHTEMISVEDELLLEMTYRQLFTDSKVHMTFHFKDENGEKIFSTGTSHLDHNNRSGIHKAKMIIPANFFNWGNFSVDLYVVKNLKEVLKIENDIIGFTLTNKASEAGSWMGREPGPIHPDFHWEKTFLHE